jgi:parallel beta-helix repeat protein
MPALLAGVVPLSAQPVLYTLKDNPTGGDCRLRNIGLWNAATKTCTLIRSLRASIVIEDDGVRLYGNLRSLKAPAQAMPFGVLAKNRTRVSVYGVAIDGFSQGIALEGGFGNTVLKNVITDAGGGQGGCGVCLAQSDDNRVEGNRITGLHGQGIKLDRSSRNRVLENVLRLNVVQLYMDQSMKNAIDANRFEGILSVFTDAIVMVKSHDNGVTRNKILHHGGAAATLDQSDRNGFLHNDFIESGIPSGLFIKSGVDNQVICNDFDSNLLAIDLFPLAAGTLVALNNFRPADTAADRAGPAGRNRFDKGTAGNYWADNIPACADADGDKFCDAPYKFNGNQDNRPWVDFVPWKLYPSACFTAGPVNDPPPETAGRLVAMAWGLAVGNGNEGEMARALAPDAQLTTGDGAAIVGSDAVAAYLKKTFTGRRFVVDTVETAASGIVVRGPIRGRDKAADESPAATLELRVSADGRWRIARIRLTSP